MNLKITSAHTLKVDLCHSEEPTLEGSLKWFWDIESLGIVREEDSLYNKFVQRITFDGHRYEVCLPWKEHHPPFLTHYELCYKRLLGLLRRLKQTPQLLNEYDHIIRDQLEKGIVESVPDPSCSATDRTHYLPHHLVLRQDKSTTELMMRPQDQQDLP